MTESAQQAQEQQVEFNVIGQFAKDVSLECPVPLFALPQEQLKIQLDVGVNARNLAQENVHETIVSVKAEAQLESGQTCYIAECSYAGVFEINGMTEEQTHTLLSIDCAAMVFPFARQVVLNMVAEAGYQTPTIGIVNFQHIYLQAQAQREAQAAAQEEAKDAVKN